jgi:hypothetical protein
MGVIRLTGSLSLTQSLIFLRVNPRTCICCLRVRSPVFLRSSHRALTKGGGYSKRISKGERSVHLVGPDLILSKVMGSNQPHCKWVSWHSFPNCNFRVLFICSTFPELWGWRPCVASNPLDINCTSSATKASPLSDPIDTGILNQGMISFNRYLATFWAFLV